MIWEAWTGFWAVKEKELSSVDCTVTQESQKRSGNGWSVPSQDLWWLYYPADRGPNTPIGHGCFWMCQVVRCAWYGYLKSELVVWLSHATALFSRNIYTNEAVEDPFKPERVVAIQPNQWLLNNLQASTCRNFISKISTPLEATP